MRICSLLPSITEILFELKLGDRIVGVTHECDWPPEAQAKPSLTRSRIHGERLTSAEIDSQVRIDPSSLYDLDIERLRELRPELILTQSLCPVCAVDETMVRTVAAHLSPVPEVRSFHPQCLADVLRVIRDIGEVTGARAEAETLVTRFDRAVSDVRGAVGRVAKRPRTVVLEWADPLFASGHWTPELVEIAGGREVLGQAGMMSRTVSWEQFAEADPEVVLVVPCGFNLDRARQEMPVLECQEAWDGIAAVRDDRVFVGDGSAYFNRPGPRLIESLEILAEILHPAEFSGLAPPQSFQQVRRLRRTNV